MEDKGEITFAKGQILRKSFFKKQRALVYCLKSKVYSLFSISSPTLR